MSTKQGVIPVAVIIFLILAAGEVYFFGRSKGANERTAPANTAEISVEKSNMPSASKETMREKTDGMMQEKKPGKMTDNFSTLL